MDAKDPGRTVRISASIPIHVAWIAKSGEREAAEARIVKITSSGAEIVLPSRLAPSQEITIRKTAGGEETPARVVGLIGKELDWHIYGVVFIDPAPKIWESQFSPSAGSDSSHHRLFLECASCLSRALITLNEIQADVFESRGLVTLSCDKCRTFTVWALAAHESPQGSAGKSTATKSAEETSPAPASPAAPRSRNRRKQSRVHSMAMACVRYSGVTEEVVRVRDASRGGFRFVSSNYYAEGTDITVAVPFTHDASNIFVPAKIIWRKELPRLEKREYGVAYTRS
ncbi:MAG: PilZ domain-containing protein [Candidatus Acidiferrales bacterium]